MRRAAIGGLAAIALLAGCASPSDTIATAVGSATSATGSTVIALELADEGAAPPTLTDTALADALDELDAAARSLTGLVPSSAAEEQRRDAALVQLRRCQDAIAGARAALARGGSLEDWLERARELHADLEDAPR